MLVDVQIIVFKKIITDIQIIPAAIIEVSCSYAQTKAYFASVNTRLRTYIYKLSMIIAVQTVPSRGSRMLR